MALSKWFLCGSGDVGNGECGYATCPVQPPDCEQAKGSPRMRLWHTPSRGRPPRRAFRVPCSRWVTTRKSALARGERKTSTRHGCGMLGYVPQMMCHRQSLHFYPGREGWQHRRCRAFGCPFPARWWLRSDAARARHDHRDQARAEAHPGEATLRCRHRAATTAGQRPGTASTAHRWVQRSHH